MANTRPKGFRWLGRCVGRRGATLLFFAMLGIVYAYGLLVPGPRASWGASQRFIVTVAPLWVWAVLWAASGLLCLVYAFRAADRVGFAAASGVTTMWGLLYVVAAVAGVSRAFIGAVIFLCLGGWVAIISSWPEPPAGFSQPERDRQE